MYFAGLFNQYMNLRKHYQFYTSLVSNSSEFRRGFFPPTHTIMSYILGRGVSKDHTVIFLKPHCT